MKNRIRLNESQLRNIVRESVKRILKEHGTNPDAEFDVSDFKLPKGYDDDFMQNLENGNSNEWATAFDAQRLNNNYPTPLKKADMDYGFSHPHVQADRNGNLDYEYGDDDKRAYYSLGNKSQHTEGWYDDENQPEGYLGMDAQDEDPDKYYPDPEYGAYATDPEIWASKRGYQER